MISIARILGAPDKVPTGRIARSTSIAPAPSRNRPSTVEEMCMTCE
jgi:hypothetical protein